MFTNSARQLQVTAYRVIGDPLLTNVAFTASLSHRTGTNLTLMDVLQAAAELQRNYRDGGYTNVTVAIGRNQITNRTVTLNVFRGSLPQILVDGLRCTSPSADTVAFLDLPRAPSTNQTVASAEAAKTGRSAETVGLLRGYEIAGDTLLSKATLSAIFTNYIGTNVTVEQVKKAATDLQMEYRRRGYPTVSVTIPQQRITNSIIKIRVFEGRLSDIEVAGNRFFSSNNVMRALPSLHTNTILVDAVFQAELDRANANQDRQIYPEIEPGPTEGTSILNLRVKDRLPLHAKLDFNNQNSPGTPDLRLNGSIAYNNLWQLGHSVGFQYGFSPESYKTGDQWNFYDLPLVANYSGFYRLPLGNVSSLEQQVVQGPANFGYNEATRKFNLPPATGVPEINFYASRSTIDTGLEILQDQVIYNVPGVRQVSRQDVQQDLTLTEDLGFRLSGPLPATSKFRSSLSGGTDYKTYSLTSAKTNIFSFTEITVDASGFVNPPIISTVASPVPTTHRSLNYLPLSLRYDGSLGDNLGTTSFGLGLSVNAWYSGTSSNLHSITGSRDSSGNWVTLTPSMSRDFLIHTNWTLSLHGEGQWVTEPLISNEQFGIGGINSVRGYHEGEVFGDTGWWLGAEQKSPAQVIGRVYANHPLTVRGVLYMEYGEAYLLDPQGRQGRTPLWGTGFGAAANIGATWEARFLFSWPLLDAGSIRAYQPRFDFGLSAQF